MKREISLKDLFSFVILVMLFYTIFGFIGIIYPDFLSEITVLFGNIWVNNAYYVITSVLVFYFVWGEKIT